MSAGGARDVGVGEAGKCEWACNWVGGVYLRGFVVGVDVVSLSAGRDIEVLLYCMHIK